MKISILLFISALTILASFQECKKSGSGVEAPSCIEKEINNIKKEKVKKPPAEVWKWSDNGETYYYITSGCCDQYSFLYDRKCNVICAPDGGIMGTGDGKCPEFSQRIEKTLIWKDERQ